MDQVLKQVVPDWLYALAALCCGGFLAMLAVTGHFDGERFDRTGRVVLLSVGTVFIVIGLLDLLDLVRERWLLLIGLMVSGILSLMVATDIYPLVRIEDISKKRRMFLSGVFWILFAVVYAVVMDLDLM